jgi:hypothetical protein
LADVINVTVTFDEVVTVTGTPKLQLDTGATDRNASYISGSGTTVLRFNYTVQAGDTSLDLNTSSSAALTVTGASIRDAALNDATLTLLSTNGATLATNKALVIDTTAPTLTVTTPTDNIDHQSTVDLNGTVNDTTAGVKNVSIYVNGTYDGVADYNVTSGVWNYTYTGGEGAIINFSIVAFDNALNNATETVSNVTLDDTPPVISALTEGTPTSSGITITWTTDELANRSVNYGTTTAVGTLSGSAAYATSQSTTLSDLTASTVYYYNVTSCDEAGNCNTSLTGAPAQGTFTTAAAGGGGGGGGGAAPGLPYAQTPMRVQLSTSSRLAFQGPDKKLHYVSIQSINADGTVTFKFTSDPVEITLKDGESGTVDVTKDGVVDVLIKLVTHSQYSANILLSKPQETPTSITEIGLDEQVPVDTTDAGTPEASTDTGAEAVTGNVIAEPDATTGTGADAAGAAASAVATSSPWPWVILAVVVAVVLGLFWMVKTKRLTYD